MDGDYQRTGAGDDGEHARQKDAEGAARNAGQAPAHRPHATGRSCTTFQRNNSTIVTFRLQAVA